MNIQEEIMAPQTMQLVMRTGPIPGKTFPLSKSDIVVGRDITSDITINDAEISRRHAKFTLQGDSYILEDLGSTNGTFVGGQRLMGPYSLKPGDLILFGENVSLSYEAVVYDPNATVVGAPSSVGIPASPAPSYTPSVQQAAPAFYNAPPPPPPAFSKQAPPASQEVQIPPVEAKKPSSSRKWVLAGCGCLVLIVLCVVVAAYAVDSMNLYCQLPIVSSFFGCP
jgi:predicted component of type VI protein secretion system